MCLDGESGDGVEDESFGTFRVAVPGFAVAGAGKLLVVDGPVQSGACGGEGASDGGRGNGVGCALEQEHGRAYAGWEAEGIDAADVGAGTPVGELELRAR